MDLSSASASAPWADGAKYGALRPAGPAVAAPPPSLDDLARRIAAEAEARKAALAETYKQLDWRFVHFADDFQRRLEQLEQRLTAPDASSRRPAPDGAPRVSGGGDEPRLHRLEGQLALAEARSAEVQRWGKALQEELAEEREVSEGRLAELEAWLAHLDRRLADAEDQLGGRRGAAGRLTPVERLTLDGPPADAPSKRSAGSSVTTLGSESAGRPLVRPPAAPVPGSAVPGGGAAGGGAWARPPGRGDGGPSPDAFARSAAYAAQPPPAAHPRAGAFAVAREALPLPATSQATAWQAGAALPGDRFQPRAPAAPGRQ